MAWAKNGTPNTLTVAATTITISDLTKRKFNQILIYGFNSGSGPGTFTRLGDGSVDSGNNYARRQSTDGGTDFTIASNDKIQRSALISDEAIINYICAIPGEEALSISFLIAQNTAGAANAPRRSEDVGKWTNTTQFDNVQCSSLSGSYDIDSNISALGTD